MRRIAPTAAGPGELARPAAGRHRGPAARAPADQSGQPRPPGSTGSTNGAGSAGDADAAHPAADPKGKATLGSTSYDGADASQFEPDWGGASWYGTTSGTYWTINPKEYADPRKHGPEYQARARRAAAGRAGAPPIPATRPRATRRPRPTSPARQRASGRIRTRRQAPRRTRHHRPSTRRRPGGARRPARPRPRSRRRPGRPPRPTAARAEHGGDRQRGRPAAPVAPDLGAAAADLGRALTDERTARGRWRLVQAIVGWLPLALGIGWLIGELTGCSRFAASCDGTTSTVLQPIVALALLGLLLLVPRLAALAAAGAVAIVVAAIPTALILSATGEAAELEARATALGVTIVVAWLVGRRGRRRPPRPHDAAEGRSRILRACHPAPAPTSCPRPRSNTCWRSAS